MGYQVIQPFCDKENPKSSPCLFALKRRTLEVNFIMPVIWNLAKPSALRK